MQLGMIGLGRMGANMVRRLGEADFRNRLRSAIHAEFGGHAEKNPDRSVV